MARFLDQHIERLSKTMTEAEIAAAAGFSKPIVIAWFRTGFLNVPLQHVPALAKVLDVDLAFLTRLALEVLARQRRRYQVHA
jgi:transcriptional regulator with XRE-family HTH domain